MAGGTGISPSQGGVSVLLTTHYLEEADRLSRRLAIVDQGRIVARGTPDELKSGLHGDRITVELADGVDAERAARCLADLPGGSEIVTEERRCTCRSRTGRGPCPGWWRRWRTPASRSPRSR